MNGNVAALGDGFPVARSSHNVSMGSHSQIVHYALPDCKRLSHYELNYSRAMTEPHERLRKARVAAGFTTSRAAARAMGVSEFTYNAHENGSRGYKAASAAQYAKKFKVAAEWLLYGKGPGPSGVVDDAPAVSEAELEEMVRTALLEWQPGMTAAEIVPVVVQALHEQLRLYGSAGPDRGPSPKRTPRRDDRSPPATKPDARG